jgi:hypothetical protein
MKLNPASSSDSLPQHTLPMSAYFLALASYAGDQWWLAGKKRGSLTLLCVFLVGHDLRFKAGRCVWPVVEASLSGLQ